MHKGQSWRAVKKRHYRRVRIKALLVYPPGLQGAAGHLKHCGGLTLRDTLSFEINILRK